MKERLVSPGIYVLMIVFLAGVWLVMVPFVMQNQPAGATWQVATIDDVASGGALIVVSGLGVLINLGLAIQAAVSGRMGEESSVTETFR